MPTALKLQEEYGEDLQVVFVECQGADNAKVESFALKKKWLGSEAIWTSERPFNLGLRGLPHFGLLSPTGEMVLSGRTNAMHSQIKEEIAAMVKSLRKPPRGTPKSIGKAWTAMGKGEFAKSHSLASEASAKAKGDEEREAAEALVLRVEERVAAKIRRARWMLENGYAARAAETVERLAKGVKGLDEAAAEVAELQARIESPEMAAELKAAQDLSKLQEKLFADGPDAKLAKKLTKLAEKHAGTKAAERARHLASLAR